MGKGELNKMIGVSSDEEGTTGKKIPKIQKMKPEL